MPNLYRQPRLLPSRRDVKHLPLLQLAHLLQPLLPLRPLLQNRRWN